MDELTALRRERASWVAERAGEARFRSLVTATAQVVWTTDADGLVQDDSPTWRAFTGQTVAQWLGRGWLEAVHPDDREFAGAAWRRAVEDQTVFTAEFRIRRQDGEYRWTCARGVPVRDTDGSVREWLGANTDITDQKEAERKLRKNEERKRLLCEAAAVLLTTDEPDTMLQQLFAGIGPHLRLDTYFNFMVNEAGNGLRLASCTGISDLEARSIENLAFGQGICGTVAWNRRPIVATSIQESDDPKMQIKKSFGIRACVCNPLMAGDQLFGTLTFASRTRDEFADDELDFLQTICQYAAAAYERLRLIRQLQQADRRKDEFLATLAHELRNPLAPLRNGLRVMKLARGDTETVEQSREMMDRQIVHMVRIVDDLLDLSRISRGKVELRKERVELAKIVEQAVETSRPLMDQAGHELTVILPPAPIFVDGDATRLSQVFANLLNNAAKYTERGGRVTLSVERRGGEVVVTVADTGVGIPAHMLPRVFDMFTQVDRSLEKSQGGLGIGLSLVKGLVELHGGRVSARSAGHGKGSAFTVRLPEAPNPNLPRDSVPTSRDGQPAAPRRRVLVVDDNRDAAISLAQLLRILGNETRVAHDGLAALDVAAAFAPHLVLLDIGMPRLNGYDTARRIREQPWGLDMRLVALTGWGQEGDKRKSQEAGFNFHMVKPIDPTELEELLSNLSPDPA
jgi:PAS domain S-box-containing protein